MTEASGGSSQPAGYGPPSGYGPRPGGIPLRPLSMGEIFNGAITSMRRSPAASLGIAAVLSAVTGVAAALITWQVDHVHSSGNVPSRAAGFSADGTNLVIGFTINVLLYGLLALVVARNVQGQATGLREAWRLARPRLPALLATAGLLLLIYCALWIPFGLVLAVAVSTRQPVAILLAVLAGLATALAEVAGWVLLSMAAIAVVLERIGPAQGLARSWRLVRASFWRILGILLLTAVIYYIAAEIIALPFTGAELATGGVAHFHVSALTVTLGAIGAVVAGTVTRPFLAGVTALVYCDTRMRREGLDLVLRAGVTGPEPTGDTWLTWAQPAPGSPGHGQPSPPAW